MLAESVTFEFQMPEREDITCYDTPIRLPRSWFRMSLDIRVSYRDPDIWCHRHIVISSRISGQGIGILYIRERLRDPGSWLMDPEDSIRYQGKARTVILRIM